MEIELKIPLKPSFSINSIIANISKKFGTPFEDITQIDTYFSSPIHNFWESDEALRLRQILTESGEEKIEITYKGPKQGESMKIREEITIEASDGNNTKKILQKLGFHAFTKIRKRRINWSQNNYTISFDIVKDLGKFLEIEIMTHSEYTEEITKSKKKIIHLAKEIIPTWSGEDERKSYLEMIIEKKLST